jgi:hypothetical protein
MNIMIWAIILAIYTIFVTTIAYAKSVHDRSNFRLREKENKKDQMLVHVFGSYFVLLPVMLFSIIYWGMTFMAFKFTLVSLAIYWIVFELILNKLRGLPLLTIGKTWIVDVWVRKMAEKTECDDERLLVAIKLLLLAICLAI